MIFQAVISNPKHENYGVATIPFPIKSSDYENTLELLAPLEIGDAVERDCRVEEIQSEWPALKRMETTRANLDELDYLAKRLDSFDEYEKTQFQGMAERLGLYGADDLINLTFCCQEITVATDFKNLEALGRRHFLTTWGGSTSAEELELVDGGKIARELIDHQIGRVTPYGVVYDNDFEMSEAYDGRHFPEYRYEDCVMEVEMSPRLADTDSPGACLYLPTTQTRIERAMLRAGIDSYADMCLRFSESELPEEIDAALDFESTSLSELNELCRAIEPLSQAEREKLGAVILYAMLEQTYEIANLAKELDRFDYVPKVQTPEEYGKYMIMESGHFDCDESLAGYIDFAGYGAKRMEQEQGLFNSRGYVAYQGTLSLDELMQGDPAESMGQQMGELK